MATKERHLQLVPHTESVTPEMIQRFIRGSTASHVPENFIDQSIGLYQQYTREYKRQRITVTDTAIHQSIANELFDTHWSIDEAEYALAYAKATAQAKSLIAYTKRLEQTLHKHDQKQKMLNAAQKDVTRKSNLPDRPAFWAVARTLFPKNFIAFEQPGSLQDEIRALENNYDQMNRRQDIYLGNVIDSFTLLTQLASKRKHTGINPAAIEHVVEKHYDQRRTSAA